jgi:DNA ligase-1
MIPQGFKPQLFPNDIVNVADIKGDYLMSAKLDGIRCLFIDGGMYSRHLKPIRNIQLQRKFEHIKSLSKDMGIIFDGEIYMHGVNFPDISGFVMSMDTPIPDTLNFWCFDCYDDIADTKPDAYARYDLYTGQLESERHVIPIVQNLVNGAEIIHAIYQNYLEEKFEGAILKRPTSPYKFGRITYKSGNGYKLKLYQTFEAKILGIEQATMAKPESVRTRNELGKSETSGKQGDRVYIDKAASFIINYEGFESKVPLAMTDEEKRYVWKHQEKFIGRMIEFKGTLTGSKDRVRHPYFVRFRDDRT